MYNSLSKDQRECRCSTCSTTELGYLVVHRHTARAHKQIDEQSIVVEEEEIFYDANNEQVDLTADSINSHNNIDDFDYMADEQILEDNDNTTQHEQFLNISSNEVLPYFVMIFLVFFQIGNLSVSSSELFLKFMNAVFALLGYNYTFPTKLSTIKAKINANFAIKGIKKYIVCTKCNCTYNYEDILNGLITNCNNMVFKPYASSKTSCNTPLFTRGVNNTIKPFKRYVYNSIKSTLQTFFMRRHFEEKIEHWRNRTKVDGLMFDIYDGAFFEEFKKDGENEPFVAEKGSLMLSLNVDWFTPTKGMNYHVGAIYLIINNLPRDERFKKHNMILVGLIPGPSEPAISDVNHFLKPMVDELLELFEGVRMQTFASPQGKIIRCALMTVNCDLPALKKTCGFTWYNSSFPCHKCSSPFPAQEGRPQLRCFANVDYETWSLRDKESNYQQALLWRNARTLTERKTIEKKYGVRWSELHRLGYFDVVRCSIVDGLHNLYLGTAKRMVDFWKSEQKPNSSQCYLTNRDLADMAVDAKKLIVPPQFTTISSKISANFSGFKGDEFRSWTIVYSAILLKGRLIGEHMMNWLRFVMANQILASSTITVSEVNEAHNLLVEFIKNNVDLYGPNFITPNMHMHLHLQQTIYDFGPLYSTWLYSFERANGDIKKIDINFKEGLEFTYMEKFLQQVHVQDYLQMLPDSLKGNTIIMNVLKHLIPNEQFKQDELILDDEDMEDLVELDRNDNNSLHQERSNGQDYLFDLETFLTSSINTGIILTGSEPLPPSALPLNTRKVIIMNNHHYNYLYEFYRSVYSASFTIKKITDNAPSSYLTAIISDQIQKFDRVNLAGQLFRCMESRTDRGAYIQAMVPLEDGCFRVGKILYFFTNEVFFPNNDNLFGPPVAKKHFFAFVRWYKPSVNQFSSFDIHNVEVWKNEFEADSILSILPLCQIHTCVALAPYIDSNVLVLPLPRRTIGM